MAKKPSNMGQSTSKAFNWASMGGAVWWILTTAAAFFVGGVIDFTFFHNHPAGIHIIEMFNNTLLSLYDTLVAGFGFPEFTRNTAALAPDGGYGAIDLLGAL